MKTLGAGALKCDACDYRETVARELTEDLIGEPCPECGANLLTREDFDHAHAVFAALQPLETMGLLKLAPVGQRFGEGALRIGVHSGTVTISGLIKPEVTP